MARNFSPVADEIQVNLGLNQNLDQDYPDVATLTDGRFFVTFEDGDGDNILGQFVNPDGTLSGGNIDIEVDAGDQYSPAVARRADGSAVVVWEDNASSYEVHYAIVSSNGSVGTEQTILDGNELARPDIGTLANGRSLVVADQYNGTDQDVIFRFIDAAGNPFGTQALLDGGTGSQDNAAVGTFGDNALVAYEDGSGRTDIKARFFDGTSFTDEVTIATADNDDWDLYEPDVAALTDGRFIVVWQNGLYANIQARFVSASGVLQGQAFDLTPRGGYDDGVKVAALPDGGFIVTSENYGSRIAPEDGESSAVAARRFDSTGTPVGDLFIVNTGDPGTDQYSPAVATNTTTGRTFFAWTDEHAFTGGDNEPEGIRGRAFDPTTDIVTDTSGDDVITTYSLGETINATAGDDIIKSLGGNDIVHGGSGFDQLKGGLGDDQLFGEADDDLLNGEDGNDLLVGGLGRDIQLGGAGRDVFDFNTTAESRGFNRDVIVGFSRAEDDRIDLATIDAETGGGNQKFHFIGKDAFSGEKGELRYAGGVLQGDTDGNGTANFAIKITGLGVSADTGDFFL